MKLSDEVKVGIFTTIAIIIILLSTVYITNISMTMRGYNIYVVFDSANDLKLSAKVKHGGGVAIGNVKNIEIIEDGKLKVKLFINNGVKIRKDSDISIYSSGIIGEKIINIIGGTDAAGFMASGETKIGSTSVGIDSAVSELSQISGELKKVVKNINDIFKKGELQTAINLSVKNVQDLSKGVKSIVDDNKTAIGASVNNFKKSSDDLAKATGDLKDLVAELNKLVAGVSKANLPQTMENLNKVSVKLDETITSLDSAAKKIDKGEGTLGVLINDKKTAEDLKAIIKDLKENPWKLLWKK